jgi:hypothetical protein
LASKRDRPYLRFDGDARTSVADNRKGAPIMQNPLVIEHRSIIDPGATRGMSHYEWSLAKARMEHAMALGEFTLRIAQSIRATLRTATAAVRVGNISG